MFTCNKDTYAKERLLKQTAKIQLRNQGYLPIRHESHRIDNKKINGGNQRNSTRDVSTCGAEHLATPSTSRLLSLKVFCSRKLLDVKVDSNCAMLTSSKYLKQIAENEALQNKRGQRKT